MTPGVLGRVLRVVFVVAVLLLSAVSVAPGHFRAQALTSASGPSAWTSPPNASDLGTEGNITIGGPGDSPSAVAVDPALNEAFVALNPTYLTVVSTVSSKILMTKDIGAYALSLAVDPKTGTLFAALLNGSVLVLSAQSLDLVATIPVGLGADGVAVNSDAGAVYVVSSSGALTVINATSDQVERSLNAQGSATTVAYDPVLNQILIAGESGYYGFGYGVALNASTLNITWWDELTQIPYASISSSLTGEDYLSLPSGTGLANLLALNGQNGSEIASVSFGTTPPLAAGIYGTAYENYGLAYAPVTNTLFAADSGGDTLVVLNASSLQIVREVDVQAGPDGIAVDDATDQVFVTNTYSQSLSMVAAANGTTMLNLTLAGAPLALAVDSTQGLILAVGSDMLYEVSTLNQTIVRSTVVGLAPQAVAFDTETDAIYVANNDPSEVEVFAATNFRLLAKIPVGPDPVGLTFDPENGDVFVSCWNYAGNGTVDVISGASLSVVKTISVGLGPVATTIDTANDTLFVSNSYGFSVSEVSIASLSVVENITSLSFGTPLGIDYDPTTGDLFVADYGGVGGRGNVGNVDIISAANGTVMAAPAIAGIPWGVTDVTGSGEVLVTNYGGWNVTLWGASDDQIVGATDVGESPIAAVYDPATSIAYVANYDSGNLSVLPFPHASSPSTPSGGFGSAAVWILGSALGVSLATVAIGFGIARIRKSRP